VRRRPRLIAKHRAGFLFAGGIVAPAAAIAALGPNGNYPLVFAYVASTLGVCACTTFATIRVLGLLWHGKSATDSAEGVVEFGLLIGLFIVSPLTLTGAFQVLHAVVGGF
jgi:hypothetical protein